MRSVTPLRSLILVLAVSVISWNSVVRVALADIYQWEWVDPNDHSLGKQQSTTVCSGGVGVNAVPYAYLSSKDLTMAYLFGASLSNASLSTTNLTDGYLKQANLTNAYASFSNLTGVDLSQANLTNAYFSYATLTGASFTGAAVSQADFSRGNYSGGGTGIWRRARIYRRRLK